MPDCSAVEVTAYLDEGLDGYTIQAVMDRISHVDGDRWGFHASWTEWEDEDAVIRSSDDDLPWGMDTFLATAGKVLKGLAIPYTATDYAHYTWHETSVVWSPGMIGPREVISVDGVPHFSLRQLTEMGLDNAGKVSALFDTDPRMFADYTKGTE